LRSSGPNLNAIELSVDVIREGWSIYKVKDKFEVTLRVKLVLLKAFVEGIDSTGNVTFGAGAKLLLTVSVPPELKGSRTTQSYTDQEIASSIVAEDLPFETVREDWNEYKSAEGITLGVKPIVTTVSRTSKYDMNGDPVYYVKHQSAQKAKVPPEVLEKLRKLLGSKPETE
jgi:hypothetical protein